MKESAMSTVLAKLDILLDKTVIPVSMRRKRNDIEFKVISSVVGTQPQQRQLLDVDIRLSTIEARLC